MALIMAYIGRSRVTNRVQVPVTEEGGGIAWLDDCHSTVSSSFAVSLSVWCVPVPVCAANISGSWPRLAHDNTQTAPAGQWIESAAARQTLANVVKCCRSRSEQKVSLSEAYPGIVIKTY